MVSVDGVDGVGCVGGSNRSERMTSYRVFFTSMGVESYVLYVAGSYDEAEDMFREDFGSAPFVDLITGSDLPVFAG